MKKLITTLLLLNISIGIFSQNEISGTYFSPWGSKLILQPDHTFEYRFFQCYHLITGIGNWSFEKDTLKLNSTNELILDSVIDVQLSRLNINKIRISILDSNYTEISDTPILAFSKGDSILAFTDSLGCVEYAYQTIDSIKIGLFMVDFHSNKDRLTQWGTAIKLSCQKDHLNHASIVMFKGPDRISELEHFDERSFLVKRKKLFMLTRYRQKEKKFNKKRYFKKR